MLTQLYDVLKTLMFLLNWGHLSYFDGLEYMMCYRKVAGSIRPDNLLHFHVLFMLREAACSRISQTQRAKAGRGVLIWVDCAPLSTALPLQALLRPLPFVFVSSF